MPCDAMHSCGSATKADQGRKTGRRTSRAARLRVSFRRTGSCAPGCLMTGNTLASKQQNSRRSLFDHMSCRQPVLLTVPQLLQHFVRLESWNRIRLSKKELNLLNWNLRHTDQIDWTRPTDMMQLLLRMYFSSRSASCMSFAMSAGAEVTCMCCTVVPLESYLTIVLCEHRSKPTRDNLHVWGHRSQQHGDQRSRTLLQR
jgi:hypothetical protein